MKLKCTCTFVALSALLCLQCAVRADYLYSQTPQQGGASEGTTSVGSVSSSSALTTQGSANSAPAMMIDNHDAGWNWSSMVEYSDPFLYQKSGYAGGPGSYGVYNFHGTGVDITGMAGPSVTLDGTVHTMGSIEVFIDGKQIAVNSLHLKQARYRDSIFKIDGLDAANHVLHIEPVDGWIVVNYITVLNTPPSVVPPPSAEVTEQTTNDGPGFRIMAYNSPSLYLDVAPGPLKGAKVDIWSYDPTRVQVWTINTVSGGKYTLSPAGHPDVVLWIEQPTPDNSKAQAFLWPYTGAPNEQMTIGGKSALTIEGQLPNTAMSTPATGFASGLPIIGATLWSPGADYFWTLQKVNN